MTTSTRARSTQRVKKFLRDAIPEQGNWSEEKYLAFTDSSRQLVEFNDGFLEVLPMPTTEHQSIVKCLFKAFDAYIDPRGGTVHFAPLRMQIRNGKLREPDLLMVLSKTDPRVQNRFWTGADLVVEVVSPDDPDRDTITKRREYARAGIPEYWIVNPISETILVLSLAGKKYRRSGSFARGDQAESVLLAEFGIGVDEVFDAK